MLKKHFAYLCTFVAFVIAKTNKVEFVSPIWNASYLNQAFNKTIKYVQSQCFGPVMTSLSQGTPDNFETIVHKMKKHATNPKQTRRVNELHTLINLRPCVGSNKLLRVEARLKNADLPTDTKHPITLPGRHPPTRLVVLSAHAGSAYALMETRQKFWIIHGVSSVKHYLADCASCTLRKAKPVRQLLAALPVCRLTACNKPFKFCSLDYLGPRAGLRRGLMGLQPQAHPKICRPLYQVNKVIKVTDAITFKK